MSRFLNLSGSSVGDNFPCYITFEAGPTHDGIETALKLVDHAAAAGAQAIKFQIFSADQLVADKKQLFEYSILISRDSGLTRTVSEPLYNILKRRELSRDEWIKVRSYAHTKGLAFFATVGFESDLEFLQQIKCDSVKIASADINHAPFLRLAAKSGMCVQIDTGSADISEIKEAVQILESEGCNSIIIHQCPSGYPARLPSICLNMIKTLRSEFPCYPIAYSDHTPDADMDIAAVALGANLIEKTITLNRCTPSVEHIFSLEPNDMSQFITRIRDVEIALGSAVRMLTEEQSEKRKLVRRSPYSNTAYSKGTPLSELEVSFRRPGVGLSPIEWEKALNDGLVLSTSLDSGQLITKANVISR